MSRSRVKSSEHYDEILGLKKEKEELTTTNNAIEYFESIKNNRKDNLENPFDRTLSLKEIKANLRSGTNGNQIENIKASIASVQANFDEDEVVDSFSLNDMAMPSMQSAKRVEKQASLYQDIFVDDTPIQAGENLDKASIYQKNASQLYDNLRDSRPEVVFNTQNKTKINQEFKKVELVEKPSSLTEQRVKKLFVNSNVIEDDQVIPSNIEVEKSYEPEIAADFTGENKTLLESIKKVKPLEEFDSSKNFPNFSAEEEKVSNTNKVLEVLPEKAAAFDEMLVAEEPQMISEDDLSKTGIIRKKKHKPAKETTYHEIRLPKSTNDQDDDKAKKSSHVDNIIIVVLIILIIVLAFLLYKAFV